MGLIFFPKSISPKVNVLERLAFELAYCDRVVQYIWRLNLYLFKWNKIWIIDTHRCVCVYVCVCARAYNHQYPISLVSKQPEIEYLLLLLLLLLLFTGVYSGL